MYEFLRKLALRIEPRAAQGTETNMRNLVVILANAGYSLVLLAIWLPILLVVTDFERFELVPFLILLVGTLITTEMEFETPLNMGNGNLKLTGSLSYVFIMSGILLFGYIGVWIALTASLVRMMVGLAFPQVLQGLRINIVHQGMQGLGAGLAQMLVTAAILDIAGVPVPFDSLELADWGIYVLAALVGHFTGLVVSTPMIRGLSFVTAENLSLLSSVLVLETPNFLQFLPKMPAPMIPTLLYVAYGDGMLAFSAMGVLATNALAYFMSQMNQRSRLVAYELEQLEKLGVAMMKEQPAAGFYIDLIRHHTPIMFQNERFEIRHIYVESAMAINGEPFDEETWQTLYEMEEPYRYEPRVPATESKQFFDRLMVKMMSSDPSDPDLIIGGIIVQRSRSTIPAIHSLGTVQALADRIAGSDYRMRVYQNMIELTRTQHELEMASTVQMSFLPTSFYVLDGFDLTCDLLPARHTSGDFYDVINLPDGNVALVVADVADKGTGAALFMALSRTLLRSYAFEYPNDPARVMEICNARMLADTSSDQFVTVFYAVVCPDGQMQYVSAGHNPACVMNGTDEVELLKRTGIPLGMLPGMSWRTESLYLAPQSRLVIYTDGVTEAQNAAGDLYGEPRLVNLLRDNRERTCADLKELIFDDVKTFVDGEVQSDDITLLVLARH